MSSRNLFNRFVEEPYDERFSLNCGEFSFPCPIFNDKLNITGWIPSKSYADIGKFNKKIVEKWRCSQQPVPVCFKDEIYRNKTPIWTSEYLVSKQLRDRCVNTIIWKYFSDRPIVPNDENVTTSDSGKNIVADFSSCGIKWRPRCERFPPFWLEVLALEETEPGSYLDNSFLGNCLSIIDIDASNSILAFSEGRLNESVRILDVSWEKNFPISCSVRNSCHEFLCSELLEISKLSSSNKETNEPVEFLCRTVNDIQLIVYNNGEITSKLKLLPNFVKSLVTNPYIPKEFCLIDENDNFIFGSINGANEILTKNSQKLNNINIIKHLEWSDHPRCLWMCGENKVYLIDIRTASSDIFLESNNFYSTPSELDVIRCIKRIDDDSRYFVITTDQALFLMDQRQPKKPVTIVHHMLLDTVKYLTVSDKLSSADGDNRLITLVGRELNEIICVPLLWHSSSSTVCELEPPFELWTSEHVLNWLQIYSPLIPRTVHLNRRCTAPFRGSGVRKVFGNHLINVFLNDIGDITYSVFDLASDREKSDQDLNFVASQWKTFIETRTSLYVPNREVSKNVSFKCDQETGLVAEVCSSTTDDQRKKCKFCGTGFYLEETICIGCRLEENQIDNLLDSTLGRNSILIGNNNLDLQQSSEEELPDNSDEISSIILDAWKNYDSV